MTAREYIEKSMDKHGRDECIAGACKASGCTRDNARRMYNKLRAGKTRKAANMQAVDKRTKAAFMAEYDRDTIIRGKIDDGLKAVGASWLKEHEFCRVAGVNPNDLGNYRDDYDEFVVLVENGKRRIWCGTKRFAAELREAVTA